MFGFLRPRNVEEVAALRDRALVAETKALLLEDIVHHQARPRRERRKDASDIKHAIAARAAAYSERFKSIPEAQRTAFIAAAKNGGRG